MILSLRDPAPKKTRGRKKGSKNQKQTTITDTMAVRKKRDRFHGMPEEEVVKRVLPDHLAPDLDIVIVRMILRCIVYVLNFQ